MNSPSEKNSVHSSVETSNKPQSTCDCSSVKCKDADMTSENSSNVITFHAERFPVQQKRDCSRSCVENFQSDHCGAYIETTDSIRYPAGEETSTNTTVCTEASVPDSCECSSDLKSKINCGASYHCDLESSPGKNYSEENFHVKDNCCLNVECVEEIVSDRDLVDGSKTCCSSFAVCSGNRSASLAQLPVIKPDRSQNFTSKLPLTRQRSASAQGNIEVPYLLNSNASLMPLHPRKSATCGGTSLQNFTKDGNHHRYHRHHSPRPHQHHSKTTELRHVRSCGELSNCASASPCSPFQRHYATVVGSTNGDSARTIDSGVFVFGDRPPQLADTPLSQYTNCNSISQLHPMSTEYTNSEITSGTQSGRRQLSTLASIMYCFFNISLGSVLTLAAEKNIVPQAEKAFAIYACGNCILGIAWLLYFCIDLSLYKRRILERISQKVDEYHEKTSMSTEMMFEENFNWEDDDEMDAEIPAFRFLKGRHSGSFFLKCGMAIFCFGHLIYEGLMLADAIMKWSEDPVYCSAPGTVFMHIVQPLLSFFQLFVIFKYSNIVINKSKGLGRFCLMHLIATNITHWITTIVADASQSHHHTTQDINANSTNYTTYIATHDHLTGDGCPDASVLPLSQIQMVSYLYPFSIEFSILCAGVWFIVWQNIGLMHHHAKKSHINRKTHERNNGVTEVVYESNLVISADCHSANKGLFSGILVLMGVIVSVIIYFVIVPQNGNGFYSRMIIHSAQEGVLASVSFLAVSVVYAQIVQLDINPHPITFLDDVLLICPLPFFFINTILNVMAEIQYGKNIIRCGPVILQLLQVLLQTPMLIDGLRRCSNSTKLKYQKVGRELITFLIILNITMWIVFTFEQKTADEFLAAPKLFGDLWIYLGHATVPMMLFYRFHSAVCFADIWKSAYESEG